MNREKKKSEREIKKEGKGKDDKMEVSARNLKKRERKGNGLEGKERKRRKGRKGNESKEKGEERKRRMERKEGNRRDRKERKLKGKEKMRREKT